jgi:hypothetical protein
MAMGQGTRLASFIRSFVRWPASFEMMLASHIPLQTIQNTIQNMEKHLAVDEGG